MGLNQLHDLSKHMHYKLRIDMKVGGQWKSVWYRLFKVSHERQNYALEIASCFKSDDPKARDALKDLVGAAFTTWDRDNDPLKNENIAEIYGGGFWYKTPNAPASLNAGEMHWNGLPAITATRMFLECE